MYCQTSLSTLFITWILKIWYVKMTQTKPVAFAIDVTFLLQEGVAAVNRHCAYCLRLCGSPAKLCGGCKKRAYCFKECQTADWSSKGNGQRHVKWCRRHECGEKDVDWEVVPFPNKGIGIRAKKPIPAGSKIIVEPAFSSPYAHPGLYKTVIILPII